MEDVLINKTALFSPHLKWVLSVLISVLPTAGCRRVQVVFRLAGSLLKCSTCVSCPRSGERGPPWCRLYSVCSPSHVTTAHRDPCWFFPFKNYTFAKETTPLPLRNKKHYKRPKKYCRLRPLSHRESGPRAARGPLVKLYQIENKCGAVQSGPCREPWVASINLSPSNKKHTKSI